MAEFPAMPFWTDAYLADTSHLHDDERGRYDLFLFHLWRAPRQRFPNDSAWLARKFDRSLEEIESKWRPLIREFCECSGNWITQKRLTREWEYVSRASQLQSVRAKARWEKVNGVSRGSTTSGIAPTPTPTPTPLVKPVEAKSRLGRGSRWPDGAVIPGEWIEIATNKRHDMKLIEIDLRLEAEKFVNYWASKSGAGATKTDWKRTWVNWALNATGVKNGNGRAGHDNFAAAAAAIVREIESGAAEGIDPDDDAIAPRFPLLSR